MPDHAKQVGILCQRVIDLLGLSMTEGQSILLGESNVAHMVSRRPAETIGKNHTARPPPALPAASIFRRGDQPQIRQGENHQHDHSPAPNKSGPALEADRRPRRE